METACNSETTGDSVAELPTLSPVPWVDLYKGQFLEHLQQIEAQVQHPPAGLICKADLLWQLRETHRSRPLPDNTKKRAVVVEQCFIPTSRTDDFIRGMETGGGVAPSKYVKIRTQPEKTRSSAYATSSTPKEVTR
jgi:hypothetical protein